MKEIKFTLPVEALGSATEALLLGDFNNWNTEEASVLIIGEGGHLHTTLLLEEGKTYEYRFLLNDGRWINDWHAQSYAFKNELNVENSVIFVPVDEVIIVEEKPVSKKPAKKAQAKSKATDAKTKKTAKEGAPVKDDLTKIEGIGPKIAKLLEAESIVTFKDLSKATDKKLKGILEAAGAKFKLHDPATWPKQAKLAAENKWEKLLELQAGLKAGK